MGSVGQPLWPEHQVQIPCMQAQLQSPIAPGNVLVVIGCIGRLREAARIALGYVPEFVSVKVMLFLCALSESLELRVGWYTNVHQPRNKA